MSVRTIAVSGAVGVVVGAIGGWLAASAGHAESVRVLEQRIDGESKSHAAEVETLRKDVRAARDTGDQAAAALRAMETQLREKTSALDAAAAEASGLRTRIDDVTAELAKVRGPAGPEKSKGPSFQFEQFGETFGAVDWDSVALHTTAIVGPIREIADALIAGKPVPLAAAGETQKHNGPLIQAVGVLGGKLSGTGPNGAYTHPAFMVNALAAALAQIGMPLSDAQRTSMEDLGRRFTAEEEKRVASYTDATFTMQKLVEEGELKNRFFDAARAILTHPQLDALSPPAIRDRCSADLWSEGLLWATVTRQVPYTKREQVVEAVGRTVGPLFKLDEAQRTKAKAIVTDWVSRLPQSLTDRKPDALEQNGMAPADLVAESAAETRKLVERVATELALSGDQLAAAKRWGVVFHPVPGAGADDDP